MKIKQNFLQIGWIYGMPRSGTTWLSQIFASCPDVRLKLCPLFSYEFKNVVDENSSEEQWNQFFIDVYQKKSEYLDQEFLRKKGFVPTFTEKNIRPNSLFIKTNRFHNLIPFLLEINEDIRFLHIIRHPCACIYSWISNPLEFPEDADPKKEWRSGKCRKSGPGEYWGFNDWKCVTSQAVELTKKYPNRHICVKYEDLVKDAFSNTKTLFRFFNLEITQQTKEFLKSSQRRHDVHRRSVFKDPKKANCWQDMLDPDIAMECINEIKGTELEEFL